MAANYFTGPDMNAAAAYELAQQDAALRRSALTNQLLSENWRNANASQLGNRSLDVDLSRQQAMTEMANNELANRVALADKADALARYRWGTPSADVTTQDRSRMEIARMQDESARNALAAQVGMSYEATQAQREANDRADKLETARLLAAAGFPSAQDRYSLEASLSQYDSDVAQATALNDAVKTGVGKYFGRAPSPTERLAFATKSGLLQPGKVRLPDGSTKETLSPAGRAGAFDFDPGTGEFYARRPAMSVPARVPEARNEFLRILGLGGTAPDSQVQAQAPAPVSNGPAPITTPGLNKRYGANLYQGPQASAAPAPSNPVGTEPLSRPAPPPEPPAEWQGPPMSNNLLLSRFVDLIAATQNNGRDVWPVRGLNYMANELAARSGVSPTAEALRIGSSRFYRSVAPEARNALMGQPNRLGLSPDSAWGTFERLPQDQLLQILNSAYQSTGIPGYNPFQ